ncbi:MAG: DNA-binding protein [Planctomycetes bacterium]|nr:DNA-binding protein [Planctomycetota bacterium]
MAKTEKKSKGPTKGEVLSTIAEKTQLNRKQVKAVMDELTTIIGKSLKKPGLISVNGLMKIKVVRKPATKAREGVNPFTGQKMMFKAKPARNIVKVAAMKALKMMA